MSYDFLGNAIIPDAYTRLIDLAWDKIKNLNEKEAIKALISIYLIDEKKKHESPQGGVDYDFCFDSLPEVISNVIFDKDHLLNILNLDDTHRKIEMKSIYNKCISDAGAKSEQSKHKITTIIDNCIYIYEAYYVRKLTPADLVRDKRLCDGINEHSDKNMEIQEAKRQSEFKDINKRFDDLDKGLSSLERKIDVASSATSTITTSSTASSSATISTTTPSSAHNITISNTPNYAQNAEKINDVLSWGLSPSELGVNLADLNELADALYDMPKDTRKILARMALMADWDAFSRYCFTMESVLPYFPSEKNIPGHTDILINKGFISDFDQSDYEYMGRDIRSLYGLSEWNYWEDIKAFCKQTKTDINTICVDVDFTVFDN